MLTIVAQLLTPFFVRGRRTNPTCAAVALTGIGLALLSTLVVGGGGGGGTPFGSLLIADSAALCWKCILLLFVGGVVVLQIGGPLAELHETDGPEFYTLLLGATLGMCLMAETVNLLMLFIAVELSSLPSYVLAGFRKDSRLGGEASLKYVLFGATATAVMAYGLSLLYGLGGTLDGFALAARLSTSPAGLLMGLALLAVLVGIGFKIAAAPFHFWCPDVFQGAAIEVTTFLSVASKGAGLMLLLRFVQAMAGRGGGAVTRPVMVDISVAIGVAAAVTMTLGNTAAFVQSSVKRMLAYSSIAQAGYMLALASLLGSGGAGAAGGGDGGGAGVASASAMSSLLLYLAVYAVMNLGAFAIAAAVARPGVGDVMLADFRGLGRRSPVLAGAMFCCLVSLIGLPPLAGLWAKLTLIWALLQQGGWEWGLAAVVVVNTILSAFYYFRIIRAMYLEPAAGGPPVRRNLVLRGLATVCAVLLVGMFFAFGPLSALMTRYGRLLSAPGAAMASAGTRAAGAAASTSAFSSTASASSTIASASR
jgi:NADH-quinone oxidoreductase subunit N